MAQKNDAQLKVDLDAVIFTNNALGITAASDNGIRTDFIDSKINVDEKGAAGGVAPLDGAQLVPIANIPVNLIRDGGYLGVYADLTALQTAHPTAQPGDTATVTSPDGNLFFWDGAWTDTGTGSLGDMLKVVYDPGNVAGNAFDRSIQVGVQPQSSVTDLVADLSGKEPVFSKNTAFNKNFGTTAGLVPDAGVVFSAINQKEDAFPKNTAFNKNFGTTAGTVAEGSVVAAIGALTTVGALGDYTIMPGGMIIQKGSIALASGGGAVAFPIAFTDTSYHIVGIYHGAGGNQGGRIVSVSNASKAVGSVTMYVHQVDTHGVFGSDSGSQNSAGTIEWVAIGR